MKKKYSRETQDCYSNSEGEHCNIAALLERTHRRAQNVAVFRSYRNETVVNDSE